MWASDFSGSSLSGSVPNNTLELFINAVRYKSRKLEDLLITFLTILPGFFYLIKTHFFIGKKNCTSASQNVGSVYCGTGHLSKF